MDDGSADNDLFEHNLRLVRESYRRKVQSLENEVLRLKGDLRDRENHIEESEREWNRKAARYEQELQEAAFKHKTLSDEKDALAQENANLKSDLRQTKKALTKLQVFKRAIQSTIDEEDHRQSVQEEDTVSEVVAEDAHRSSRSEDGPTRSTYASASRSNGTYNVDSPYSAATTPAAAASGTASPGYVSGRTYSVSSSPSDGERSDGARDVVQQIDRTLQNNPSPSTPSPLSDRVKQILQYEDLSNSLPVRGAKADQPSEEKVFFQEARQRLSWNQFNVILANIKRLNANEQTKDTTLEIAKKIFGDDNSDLYWTFRKLLTRGEKL
eukprot:TRINITY_DN5573_c0_g1_i1.p1 TRINITY_DN5573_c0_g1~~TRINITY_DN5573_c0_g1_i1.p1  ORF type:complete len:348 (+),score=117.35 TRINITY_DN5573_c0_g1_i1:69-1046(+)